MVHYMGASPEVGYTSVRSDVGEEFVSFNALSFAVLLHKQLTDWLSLGEGCDVGLLYMRNDFDYSGQDYAVRRVGVPEGLHIGLRCRLTERMHTGLRCELVVSEPLTGRLPKSVPLAAAPHLMQRGMRVSIPTVWSL